MNSVATLSRKDGKIFKAALALVTFLGASGTLGWMLLSPGALKTEIQSRTGFPMEVETLAINPFGLTLTGKNVVIGNPGTFGGGKPMLDIESLRAEASLPSLTRGEIWVYDLELRIRSATLVVDEGGRLNLDVFTDRVLAASNGSGQMPFFAERARLTVEELTVVDNSRIVPRNHTVRALLDVEFSDLESLEQVFAPIRDVAISVGTLPLR